MKTPKIEVTEVDVTPEQALEWLTRNENNRKLSPKHVEMYTKQMLDGEFPFVGDPIRFDRDGLLIDGQHRLHAILQSETTQHMVVITGLPPESQLYLDAGRRRSPGDQLLVALGVRDGNRAAGIVRTHLQWKTKTLINNNRKFSIPEIVEWASENEPALEEATRRARRLTQGGVPTSGAVTGAVYIAAREINLEDANRFWDRLEDGTDLDAKNPILVLRNSIQRRRRAHHWTPVEEFAYYVRCWNAWRKDEDMVKLQGWRGSISLDNLRLR